MTGHEKKFNNIKRRRSELDERVFKKYTSSKTSEKNNNTTYGEVFMDKLLTAKELSEKLNLSISKLAIDRMKERGIPFIKWKGQGQRGTVRYSMPKVQEFIENNMKAKA